MPDALAWPPTKEDLERLYLVEKLSAAKIARAYGLKYKTPKVAESTVLYQLKKNGIPRRDPAEHVRKVTPGMVDDWVRRYQAGQSLKQIANKKVNPVTVWNHLKGRGLGLRDKVEAQILAVSKHPKHAFDGSESDAAYLTGFVKGDCQVIRHGRAIRVRTSTTHPAMAELFANLFKAYGYVHKYPRAVRIGGYEWSLEVDLNRSFDFLFRTLETAIEECGRSAATFIAFLSGFFDAEGSIYFHRKGKGGGFELSLSNTNDAVLIRIKHLLAELGYYSKLDTFEQELSRLGYDLEGRISRLVIRRAKDVLGLLGRLQVRHQEKVARAAAAIDYHRSPSRDARALILRKHEAMKSKTREDVERFIEGAKQECSARSNEVTGHLLADRGT
ncbi:MAG TPA: LAGLIDADG family homing endonuclease [Nitrososphaerales archaeon]|nr:LAGLIDADG family homing endonuclease [Nitrososphaerales archaeon]